MLSLGKYLENSRIKWFTDNTSVCSIVENGLMNREWQKTAIEIFTFCTENGISLEIEWLPRTLNQKADYFSKIVDCDDWVLSVKLFNMLNRIWSPFTTDWFVSEHNAKIGRYDSQFWSTTCKGIDAFTENWGDGNGLFVPPINLIPRVLMHMSVCKGYGVLVVPLWRSNSFWPMLA